MNLLGPRGDKPPHIYDHLVYETGLDGTDKLHSVYNCQYCKSPLPEAGLGMAFWTREVLVKHLAKCKKTPLAVIQEANCALFLMTKGNTLAENTPSILTTKEIRSICDALVAFFDGLDRVSQKYDLIQPGIALTLKHRTALDLAHEHKTPIPTLEVFHIGETGTPCSRCGHVIPLGSPLPCLAEICGEVSPKPVTLKTGRFYVVCDKIDCDGTHASHLHNGTTVAHWEEYSSQVTLTHIQAYDQPEDKEE
jgi:hypothetical protein